MIELIAFAGLLAAGLAFALVMGTIFLVLKIVLWTVFLPFRLLFKLLWIPFGLVTGAVGLAACEEHDVRLDADRIKYAGRKS